MALKLNERYPGRFNNPSADYPQGSFKNRTTPTAKDGSYLEQDWANDKEGFFQSLISVAGVTPSGTADKVGTSQYYDALLTVLYAAARKTPVLNDTGTTGSYAAANTPTLIALPSTGYMQRVKIANPNTGPSTYSPDGLAAKPVYGLGLQPLQGGELPAGIVVLMYLVQAGVNGGNGAWILIESLGGAQQVPPATKSQHAIQLGQATGRLLNVQKFDTSGTYTPTAGTTKIRVRCQGGGGGGGGTPVTSAGQVAVAGGGGAGAYSEGLYANAVIQSVVVGSAGLASGASASPGGVGGASSVGSLISAAGGVGGGAGAIITPPALVSTGGAAGALPALGNVANTRGQAGGVGVMLGAANAISGYGGSSVMGAGATPAANAAGQNSLGYGGGGSGASAYAGSPATSGGTGGQGVVIIEEYA
ncbi:glycine-rich domain-containing protein [Pseudomonas sp. G3-19]